MFLGHIAAAFAAKPLARKANLGILCVAADLPDILWPLFLLAGIEKVAIVEGATAVGPLQFLSYPYSHSLLFSVIWAVAFGGVYFLVTRYKAGALAVAALVVSHWLLDFASHLPDMPLALGDSPKWGLGLWKSLPATLMVEGAALVLGSFLYLRATRPLDKVGKYGFAGFVVFLVVLYAATLLGPPPPNVQALAISGLAIWAFFAWPAWVDRHRTVTSVGG